MHDIQETMELTARVELMEAWVERAEEAAFTVRIGARLMAASVAPSCLLRPEEGDRVLVSHSRRATSIIAVLERGDGEACLVVEGGTPLRLRGTEIALESSSVSVLASEALRLHAGRATVRAHSLQLVADAMTMAAGAIRTVADSVDAVADRVTEHFVRSFRRVEREHVEAGDLTSRCTGIHETSGDAVVVVGRRVAKIDGGQIQIG